MRRFKKILVVFDLTYGGDETLERALELVHLNDADLTVLHVLPDNKASSHLLEERQKLMARLVGQTELENSELHLEVLNGDRVDTILETVDKYHSDLIVLPTEYENALSQLMGTDTVADLMRRAACPIWIVRPNKPVHYKKIVAAVNAGKEGAYQSPTNKRILTMASSLAEIEGAELDVLYAYQYSKEDERIIISDQTPGSRSQIMKDAYAQALSHVTKLMNHLFESSLQAKPVALQGDPQDVIVEYLKETNADLLVIEEKPDSPLVTAVVGNPILRLLHEAGCAVLISRPAPVYGGKSDMPQTKVVHEKTTLN